MTDSMQYDTEEMNERFNTPSDKMLDDILSAFQPSRPTHAIICCI